jgi:hypothetical protein
MHNVQADKQSFYLFDALGRKLFPIREAQLFKIWECVSCSQLGINDVQVQCHYLGTQDENGEFFYGPATKASTAVITKPHF